MIEYTPAQLIIKRVLARNGLNAELTAEELNLSIESVMRVFSKIRTEHRTTPIQHSYNVLLRSPR